MFTSQFTTPPNKLAPTLAWLLTSVFLASCGWRSGTPQIQPLFLEDVTGVVVQEGLRQMVEAEVKRGLIERRPASGSVRALTVVIDADGSQSSGKLPGVEGGAVVYGAVLVLSARIEGVDECRPVVEVVEQWALAPDGAVVSAERRSARFEEMVIRGSRLLLDKLTLEPECR